MSNFINQNIYPKDRHNVFSEFLEYFGNIFDIDNFIKTYQNYLTDDELLELKNQFPHFKELADSLNKFFSNISGLNDDSYHFKVGMIPLELNELKKEDLHQENQYGDWNKQKIQFNQKS